MKTSVKKLQEDYDHRSWVRWMFKRPKAFKFETEVRKPARSDEDVLLENPPVTEKTVKEEQRSS